MNAERFVQRGELSPGSNTRPDPIKHQDFTAVDHLLKPIFYHYLRRSLSSQGMTKGCAKTFRRAEMNESRNVEDVTFTYFTGQDNSVQSGPHCHSCMNRMYHDGKLDEVRFAYVPTLNGFIEFRLRTLVFLYGIQAPFTMTSFSEDISPRKCTLCASETGSQDISDSLREHQPETVTRKRKLNADCLKEESDIPVYIEDVSMDNIIPKIPRTNSRSQPPTITLSDSEDLDEPRNSNIKPEVAYNIVSQYPTIPVTNPSQQTRSQPPTITLSDSEDLDEPRKLNIKPEVAYNIVSQYPTIPVANPSQQIMVPTIGVESSPTAQSDHSAINFPFIRGRNLKEVTDSMTKKDVLTKVAALRATVQTHLIPMANLYFSSMKENTHFHCDHCDFDVWTSCGIAVVHHILSVKHLLKVYTQGLVYSKSDDYDRLVNICQEIAAAGIDFPFFHAKSRSEVDKPFSSEFSKYLMQLLIPELKKLTKFSWDLSDEVLTSIANSYFRDMKMIYCHLCNVIFKAPLGSELIRHYISLNHFYMVTNSGRCFSTGKDLERFKRIYRDAAAEYRPKQ